MFLSDNDILRELIEGENLMIYPFKKENIKGSSINLTASKYAWRIKDGKSAVVGNKIIISPQETVCIYTEESFWVSRRITGTYHSKVSQVSEGLGHISTTLDPQWLGISLIAVPNHTNTTLELAVGATFVSLMLAYLKTPATKGKNENPSSRQDLASRFEQSPEDKEYLRKDVFRSFEGLKSAMVESESYKELTKEKNAYEMKVQQEKKEFKQTVWYPTVIGVSCALVGSAFSTVLAYFFLRS